MPAIEIDISILLAFLTELGQLPPHLLAWEIFKYLGWIPILFTVLWGIKEIHLMRVMGGFASKQSYISLAIDIPRDNEQTPKAFENILNQFAGAHSSTWWYDLYTTGEFQQGFSLEIVSIEGHIQFVIRFNVKNRDLVEASVYAQYPDAELTEVTDFTEDIPIRYPNENWDVWGTEFIPVKHQVYPIRGYSTFGDPLNDEYKDPMAGFLEIMSRIGNGEQIWFQMIIIPISQGWTKEGKEEINKLRGIKPKRKSGISDAITAVPAKAVSAMGDVFFSPIESTSFDKKEDKPKNMMDFTPGEGNVIKGIEEKCSKIGFKTKIRLLYLGKHEVFSKAKAASALVGAIKQFNTEDLNSLKPEFNVIGIGGDYFFKGKKVKVLNRRKSDLMMAFAKRIPSIGTSPFVLNVEEIASLYHFPVNTVKTPLLQRVESKTAAPPSDLPGGLPIASSDLSSSKIKSSGNVLTDSVDDAFDFDTDYFEQRFAVNKPIKKVQKSKTKSEQKIEKPVKSVKKEMIENIQDIKTDQSIKSGPPSNLPI